MVRERKREREKEREINKIVIVFNFPRKKHTFPFPSRISVPVLKIGNGKIMMFSQQAGIFKIRKSLGEIKGRNREIERHRNKETELTTKIPRKARKLI
jgi:hypothetical protein